MLYSKWEDWGRPVEGHRRPLSYLYGNIRVNNKCVITYPHRYSVFHTPLHKKTEQCPYPVHACVENHKTSPYNDTRTVVLSLLYSVFIFKQSFRCFLKRRVFLLRLKGIVRWGKNVNYLKLYDYCFTMMTALSFWYACYKFYV